MKKVVALIIGAGMAIGAYFLFGVGGGGEGAPLTAGQARESGRQAQLLSKMFRKFEAGLESLSMTQVEAYQSLAAEFRAGLSDISKSFSTGLSTISESFTYSFEQQQKAIEALIQQQDELRALIESLKGSLATAVTPAGVAAAKVAKKGFSAAAEAAISRDIESVTQKVYSDVMVYAREHYGHKGLKHRISEAVVRETAGFVGDVAMKKATKYLAEKVSDQPSYDPEEALRALRLAQQAEILQGIREYGADYALYFQ